jgi:subtilisin family serine protease
MWKLGAEGQGVVVANIDTGIFWNHTGLINQYRGWKDGKADHDFNWWDGVRTGASRGCPLASKVPCDDHGHGTHTIGTVVGRTANDIVGLAYKSKWIGCRGFNVGYLSPGAVEGCMQFLLAPTKQDGTGADPQLAPDVISHSYGVPDSEVLKRAFLATEQVGIINVASAGNSGSCRSITRIPGIYARSFTVGALAFQSQNIVGFSSKGPGPAGYKVLKPEIAASGERVNSYARGGGKTPMSGTSMSSPLVNGAIAALWSKFPDYKNKIDETVKIFEEAIHKRETTQCGAPAPRPNYVYGFGNLDCEKAYKAMEENRL